MVRRLPSSIFALFALSSALGLGSGCGSSSVPFASPKVDPSVDREHTRRAFFVVDGSLAATVEKLYPAETTDECARRDRASAIEMARALDEKQAEIEAFLNSRPASTRWRRFQVGPARFRELITPVTPASGWQEYADSWSTIRELYEEARGKPMSFDWTAFNSSLRSMLLVESERLEGLNVYLDRDAEQPLRDGIAAIEACLAREACVEAELGQATMRIVALVPSYRGKIAASAQATDAAGKRQVLEELRDELRRGVGRYEFKHNATVSRPDARTIRLPLDAGPFEGVTKEISALVEREWKSDELRVEIEWTRHAARPEIFRVLLGEASGERPYVDRSTRVMQLFNDIHARAVPHEVGHVLGFRDRYYEFWRPDGCRWVTQYREDDLMSDSTAGVVLPEDWRTLAAKYPLE